MIGSHLHYAQHLHLGCYPLTCLTGKLTAGKVEVLIVTLVEIVDQYQIVDAHIEANEFV